MLMIKEKELRIGNYVNVSIIDQPTFSIDLFEFPKNGGMWELKDLSPIELTNQWLIDFGFNIDYYGGQGSECFTAQHKNKLFFRIVRAENTKGWKFLSQIDSTNEYYFTVELMFVHQLQNLFFALTGEDLKKKPRQ